MPDLNSNSSFYLGRKHDLATGFTAAEALLYESKQLTTHAVCVGMTGSGKTGLCLSLLEEAALDGVPAIAIDPKGDLGNLLLTFPNLAPSDFRPWIDESEAARKGVSPEDYAAQTAEQWKQGLAKWDQGPERITEYNSKVERLIFTPGSSAGIPLTVLKSFSAPPEAVRNDGDIYRSRVSSSVSGLLGLLGIDADPVRSREHIFLSNVLDAAWQKGQDLTVAELIREIQSPPFTSVGVMDVETFYPAKERTKLAMDLNNLLASPSFAGWMQGAPLDVHQLLYSPEGKPRLSIISISHLDDAQRMFFVTILLSEVLAWIRTQPGTSNLRAILYMDEVFGYFPPTANPPSKEPMLTLLKQARAFGLGCVLATQNPVDLDYKGLSNAGTWFLGRLQTERDKLRVMEGLEGASAQAGSTFNKQEMQATLAGLGNRVFLMNNVHLNTPQVFHTRWAMSYLRGPLTRSQIQTLMDPVRGSFAPMDDNKSAERAKPQAATQSVVLPTSIEQQYLQVSERLPRDTQLLYRPALLGAAKLHFVKGAVDVWQEVFVVKGFNEELPDGLWDGSLVYREAPLTEDQSEYDCEHAPLPAELANEKNYKGFRRELEDYLYQQQRLTVWRCEALEAESDGSETREAFLERLAPLSRKRLEEKRDEIRTKFASKLKTAEEQVRKKREAVANEESKFWARIANVAYRVLDLVFSMVRGGATSRRMTSSATAAREAMSGRGGTLKVQLGDAEEQLKILEEQLTNQLTDAERELSPATAVIDEVAIPPRKADIDVDTLLLAWLPYRVNDGKELPVW